MIDEKHWADKYQAKEDHVYVCHACAKWSTNRAIGPGFWDESCFLHAREYPIEDLVFEGDRVKFKTEAK